MGMLLNRKRKNNNLTTSADLKAKSVEETPVKEEVVEKPKKGRPRKED